MPALMGPFWAGDRPIASFHRNGGKVVVHGWCQGQFMSLDGSQRKIEGFSMFISDHAGFRAIVAARAAKCFTMVSLFEKRPPFLGSRRFMVSPDVRAIQKSHSEHHSVLFLNQFEQVFPYAEFRGTLSGISCERRCSRY